MDIVALMKDGTASPVLMLFLALAIGALHGLEPGHSKTMMAAFIIAVKGTITQAVQLGLAATVSHSVIVWILGLVALYYGQQLIGETLEPWFVMTSGGIIILVALWVFARTWQVWRKNTASHKDSHHHHDHGHHHSHDHSHPPGDAHALAHAREIEGRFGQTTRATTGQTIAFGLTGGLIPCPAAITVLILCLHTNQFWLGVGLVSAFSIGLAITLVSAGVVAAIGLRYARTKTDKLDEIMARAPFLSAGLIGLIGCYMAYSGWSHIGPL
ncbi:nickel/cobalt efflux transporter [Aestuariispira ectoiniformans]|uniref:nickel/cobalt efflux transporter n=1 Tax=Aestuariispira ectoiniformans TaxID=2775080 RepID=UPI00223C262E|nr:nickel/cobalt efflux transporter [Aestuariispira ectoiniformans]